MKKVYPVFISLDYQPVQLNLDQGLTFYLSSREAFYLMTLIL